jgi:hypothetical protein
MCTCPGKKEKTLRGAGLSVCPAFASVDGSPRLLASAFFFEDFPLSGMEV